MSKWRRGLEKSGKVEHHLMMGKFNFKDQKDFDETKDGAEKFYKTIGEAYCP